MNEAISSCELMGLSCRMYVQDFYYQHDLQIWRKTSAMQQWMTRGHTAVFFCKSNF